MLDDIGKAVSLEQDRERDAERGADGNGYRKPTQRSPAGPGFATFTQ